MAEKTPGVSQAFLNASKDGTPKVSQTMLNAMKAAAPAKTSAKPDFSFVKQTDTTQQKPNQNIIDWGMDILSRPLFGVTNVIHDLINEGTDLASGKKSIGDEIAANPLGPAGSFLSGFFSTNPDTHRYTSDVIESATDKIGSAVDPNYKDVPNNVNPALKGALGIVGDIGLDPTTYIPGAQVLKGIELAKNAAKGTTALAKDGLTAVKEAAEAKKASTAARDLSKAEQATAGAEQGAKDVTSAEDATKLADQGDLLAQAGAKRPKVSPQAELPVPEAPVAQRIPHADPMVDAALRSSDEDLTKAFKAGRAAGVSKVAREGLTTPADEFQKANLPVETLHAFDAGFNQAVTKEKGTAEQYVAKLRADDPNVVVAQQVAKSAPVAPEELPAVTEDRAKVAFRAGARAAQKPAGEAAALADATKSKLSPELHPAFDAGMAAGQGRGFEKKFSEWFAQNHGPASVEGAQKTMTEAATKAAEDVAAAEATTPAAGVAPTRASQVLKNQRGYTAAKVAKPVTFGERFLQHLNEATKPGEKRADEVLANPPMTRDEWIADEASLDPEAPAATLEGSTQLANKDVAAFLADGDPTSELYQKVSDQLDVGYEDYLSEYRKANPTPKQLSEPADPTSLLDAYHAIMRTQDGQDLAESALGSALAQQLNRMKSTAKFQAQMQEIGRIIARKLDLDAVVKRGELFDTTHAYLRHLGIEDLPALNEQVRAFDATSHVGEASTKADRKAAIEADPDAGDVYVAMNRALGQDILAPAAEFTSKRGAQRTSDTYGQGYAWFEKRLNSRTIQNMQHELMLVAERRAKDYRVSTTSKGGKAFDQAVYGPARAEYKFEQLLQLERVQDQILEREGITQFLGTDTHTAPISMSQIDEILAKHGGRAYIALRTNLETAVPVSNLLDAVQHVVANGFDRDAVSKILLNKKTKWGQGKKEFDNPLAGDGQRRYGHHPKKGFTVLEGPHLLASALDMLEQSASDLHSIVAYNAANIGARTDAETGELLSEGVQQLAALMSDPAEFASAIRAITEKDKLVEDAADAGGALNDSTELAKANLDASLPPEGVISTERITKPADKAQAAGSIDGGKDEAFNQADRLGKQFDVKREQRRAEILARAKAGQELSAGDEEMLIADRVLTLTDDTADEVAALSLHTQDPLVDISQGMERKTGTLNWLKRAFNMRQDMGHLADEVIHDTTVIAAMRHSQFAQALHELAVKHGTSFSKNVIKVPSATLKQAWGDIRAGVTRSADPAVELARQDLETLISQFLDPTSKQTIVGNALFRGNVAQVDMLNEELRKTGLKLADGSDAAYDVDAASTRVGKNQYKLDLEKLADQWRKWDVDDPLEMILKYSTAAERVATKSAMAESFMRIVRREGWISDTPKAGFARPSAQRDSTFISMIPGDKYYDADILRELRTVDEFINGSRSFSGGMGTFVHGFFDPIQQSWKTGMTVYRPGHHVRNLIGDSSMTYIAEGMKYAARSNKDAIKILATMRNQYDGVDFGRMLMGMDYAKQVPGGSEILSRGKYGDLSIAQIDEFAMENGLYHTYQMVEDLPQDEVGKFSRITKALTLRGGQLEHTVGKVSEARDHYSRLQHYMQIIHKLQSGVSVPGAPKNMNLDQMMAFAARRVKRYHPDGSMLTNFESKYIRRIIPFYSWIRGALPAVIESTMINPARVMAFPKASYNLAVGMGVNPASVTDPFPQDQLFPSFLTDQVLGPQFGNASSGYWGINPGIASIDVPNQFLANDPNPITSIVRGVASSVTPIIRMPFEMMSGAAWGTGAQIKDPSDYLDASIPGLNYLANVSGYSPTGSVVSSLTGQGLDKQYQQSKGNKGLSDQAASAFNWFTGLGLNNMSRPNYINYAEIEKRNAAAPQTRSGF